MTTPLSPEYLAEIAARAEAATAGPWGFYDGDNYADVAAELEMTGRGSYTCRQQVARLEDESYWDDPAHEEDDEELASEQMAADAAFITAARTDIPTLLAEVDRLRAELAARPTRDEADAEIQRATDGLREAWTSEIERLRRLHTGALAERDRYRSAWQSARYRAALTHSRRTA